MCSAVASRIGQYFGLAKHQVRMMVPVGAGAGLAAVFNAPLAGMFFVYEELIGELSSKALFGILIAVVTAAIVERTILGENPLFTLDLPNFETSWWMLLCIPLGIVCAALGTLFVRTLLALRQEVRHKSSIPAWLRPALAGLMIGLAGVMAFQLTGHYGVFSTGYADLALALNGRLLVPYIVLILLVGKCFAYVVAATAGTSGGIFAPVLFMGGMTGALVGLCGQMLFGCGNDVVGAVALMGMGALFASVIRCPLASFMIVFEMTHNYTIMLPLMAGNIIAYVLSVRWHPIGLYDSMLLQDRITIRHMPAYQGGQDWHNLPVKAIMTFDVVSVDGAAGAAESLAKIAGEGRSHHAYPVLDQSGTPSGMITHSELEKLKASGSADPVMRHVDRERLVSVSPETSISDVARVLVRSDVLQVPVVQQAGGKLLGIVTLHDIARQQNAIEDGV
jgi:CIC family chloride channel protein